MATWTAPTDVVTGQALTSLLWNEQLGANGSLQYVYDELNGIQLKRHAVLYKSTNTVFAAAGNSDIAFDTIVNDFTDQRLNFPVTVPITNIPIPAAGMYIITFQFRTTAANVARTNAYLTSGAVTRQFTDTANTSTAAVLHTHTMMFYAPASSTFKINLQVSAANTYTAAAPSATDGSQVLTIARI